ncbi:hypothetical protein [Pontimicrobium sp. IMCC45349]|uniref:hypothetical protein n=1 Tax=Pontimicrobium sp. IMCC45349 TaxID=3391574 RepID=UPI0039A27A0E
MGIILLPLILGALIIGLTSLGKLTILNRKKQIKAKEILFGLITSISLFVMICLSYIIEGKALALSPAFRIPIYMIFIPFIFHITIAYSKSPKLTYISKIILISIVFTTTIGVIFHNSILGLIDLLGIEKYY